MKRPIILIASDHAGVELKQQITQAPLLTNVEFKDLGPYDTQSVDYPDYAVKLCDSLLKGEAEKGILICGSGVGMEIGANRFKGIRAANCWSTEVAKLSRLHNDCNVLCLGSRLLEPTLSFEIVRVWLDTPFEGGRHLNRIRKLDR